MIDESLLNSIVRPMPRALYEVDHAFSYVESALAFYGENGGLDLLPNFQRGHIWTQQQQERWIEAVLRGAISTSGLLIQLNSPAWDPFGYLEKLPKLTVCVDGLQRLTAIRRFVSGEISAFGMTVDQFADTSFDVKRYRFKVAVHAFQTEYELLQYYLDINSGGTPHSQQEIERVTSLKNALKGDHAA